MAKQKVCVEFSKIGTDIQNKTKFPTITFQNSDFMREAMSICYKYLLKEYNFRIFFSFILHHKYQNNLSDSKLLNPSRYANVKSDFRFVQGSFCTHCIYD